MGNKLHGKEKRKRKGKMKTISEDKWLILLLLKLKKY